MSTAKIKRVLATIALATVVGWAGASAAAEDPAKVPASGGSSELVTVPTAEFICKYTTADPGMPKDLNIGRGFQMVGDYLYLSRGCNKSAGGIIQCFKWDPQSASTKLTFVGSVTNSTIHSGFKLCHAGGRLYGLAYSVWGASEDNGLAWWDIEPETGKLIEKGVITNKAIINNTWGGQIIADSQGKNLYVYSTGN